MPLSIYIHWPFCQSKCPYCDFNSHVRASVDQEEWTKAYIKSLNYWGQKLPNQTIKTIFFGGGTPSLMSEHTVENILETIFKLWSCQSEIEISLEANPTSVEMQKFKAFQKLGVNRLSMGVQALNDKDLKLLGRLHTAQEAKNAFDVASGIFEKVSFDLIYGRQYQSLKSWELELSEAIKMSVGHLSLYQLTIEENTRFGDLLSKGRLAGLPNDTISTEFYDLTNQVCEKERLSAYEISNYAKKGEECQHNLNYWRGGPFLGIGPGAHGRINIKGKRYQTEAPAKPEIWLNGLKNHSFENFTCQLISNLEQAEEYVIMALRLKEGFDLRQYFKFTKQNLKKNKLDKLLSEGLIQIDGNKLITTKDGKLLTNFIIKELLC